MKKFLLILILGIISFSCLKAQLKEVLYVGTYSVRGSEGIYVIEFDRQKGALKLLQTVPGLASPTYLESHPSKDFLYSVNREGLDSASRSGSVHSYSIDQKTGKLSFINKISSYGETPAHINIDQTGKLAFVSNYMGENLIVYPLSVKGAIEPPSDSVRHSGSSVHPKRQDKPYVHSAFFSPDNRFVLVSDLGADKVFIYEINHNEKKIRPAKQPFASVKPGSGPRHLTFHPNGKFVYLLEELTSTVCIFSFEKKTGALKIIEDGVQALPDDFSGSSTASDIHTDPSGKFLYMSHRGHNSLSVFSINGDGKLNLLGHQETFGKTPRGFLVDPKGEYLFVSNQDSDNIVIFKRDNKTGLLTYTGTQINIPSPACLKIVELK